MAATNNLRENPSFEVNTTGWTLEADYTRSDEDAHDGEYSIKQVSAADFSNFMTRDEGLSVHQGAHYVLKFWTKCEVTSGSAPKFRITHVDKYGDEGINGGQTLLEVTLPESEDWIENTFSFIAPADVIWLRVFNNNGAVTVFYDDYSMYETITTGKSPEQVLSELASLTEVRDMQFVIANHRSILPTTKQSVQAMLADIQGIPQTSHSEQQLWFDNVKTTLGLTGNYTQYSIQSMLVAAQNAGMTLAQVLGEE